MTDKAFEKAVYEALLKAAVAMGPRLKGMSCFLHNWRVPQSAAEDKKAA